MKRIIALCGATLAALCASADAATLGEALNATNLNWTTGGAVGSWVVQSTETHDGSWCAQSGRTDMRQSWLETSVIGPGWLSFWWKCSGSVSSLIFYTNGVQVANRDSWIPAWYLVNYLPLAPGQQVLRWEYSWVNTFGQQNDQGWVDEVAFLSANDAPYLITQPLTLTNDAATSVTFTILAGGAPPMTCRWVKDGFSLTSGTNAIAPTATLTLTNLFGGDTGDYSVVLSNRFGSVTSAVAHLTVMDPVITSQPAGQGRELGETATLSVAAAGTNLRYQWWKDGIALPGATAASLIVTNLQATDSGSQYQVVVTSLYGSVTSAVAVLAVNLATVDNSFDPGANNSPLALAVQTDGKILVGGQFTTLGGQARNYLGRLNADGTLDSGFALEANGAVQALVLQADGKVLVGGAFAALGGQPRYGLARLNADGTLDHDFTSGVTGGEPGWWNPNVSALAPQADGKLLVSGQFKMLCGQPRNYIGRLNADGTLDTGFNPGAEIGSDPSRTAVLSVAVQADGKILMGGVFATLGVQPRAYLSRLNPDGTVDSGFNPGANGGYYPFVDLLAVQADAKILVGGRFATLGGQPRSSIARLNADGTLDSGFDPSAEGTICLYPPSVYSLAVQADGKILLGGCFSGVGGQAHSGIARVNADGTLDGSFNLQANATVHSVAVQADGRILVGGLFTGLGMHSRNSIGRLNNTETATQSLTYDGSSITWLRGGASPEVQHTSFEFSTNGSNWSLVGVGARIIGGWSLSGVSLPSAAQLRARGVVYAGHHNASSWFVESRAGSAVLLSQPASRTNDAGTTTIFSVVADGSQPLSFSWLRDGRPLTDGANISGSTTAALTLTNLLVSDFGGYSVVVSNSLGSITSAVASLTVRLIAAQPASRTNNAGTTAAFSVGVAGSGPSSFQWLKDGVLLVDGVNLAGATSAALRLTNVLGGNAGGYSVMASNAWGTVTSAVASLTVIDPVITAQPVSQSREPGQSVTFSVTAVGTAPLEYQWWKDGLELGAIAEASLPLTNVQTSDAGRYRVVVGNRYSSVTSAVAELTVNLATVDGDFNPGASGSVNSYYSRLSVYALAVQPDGKILVGGEFSTLGGQPRANIGRLNADGSLDSGFNPGASGSYYASPVLVYALTMQADGKILVGGGFTTLGGQPHNNIGRLNADGTPDNGFNSAAHGIWPDYVVSLAMQADGKILVGGHLNKLNGEWRSQIGRLNADGTLDSGFDPGANGIVSALTVQADGRILVGGEFTTLRGQSRNRIARLNMDGTVDDGFNPGADSAVASLAVQADGRIVVGGSFTTLGGQARHYIGRLNADGTLDSGFNPKADNAVASLALQANGKILVGGAFTSLDGHACGRVARLNTDGTLDSGFHPWASAAVSSLTLQTDGKILVGGSFTNLGGQPRNFLARVNNTEPATQSLGYDGSIVTWLREGASPEVWRTSIEASTNGSAWIKLGEGSRIPGGWEFSGVFLPPDGTLRARGYVSGRDNASGWFVESYCGKLLFVAQPASRTNQANTVARFSVVAGGTEPLNFQWHKDEVPLADSGSLVGAATPVLTLTNALGGDAGGYSVVVSNALGSMTSAVARLTVIDPLITVQPVSQNLELGQNTTLGVTALGTAPLKYRWWKNGIALAGAAEASLSFTNIQASDTGPYFAVVSNQYGSVTSVVAELSVNLATLDSAFDPQANAAVFSLAVQADGKILAGGQFTAIGGQPRDRIARLNADGTADPGFNPGADNYPYCLAVQADGKIVVGGLFTTLGGQPRSCLGRLNADGSLDNGFILGAGRSDNFTLSVDALAVQADGSILVGGHFTSLGGQPRSCIGRLGAAGTLDNWFNPGAGRTDYPPGVNTLVVQPDGKILVGGSFTTLGGQSRKYFARLYEFGAVDGGFDPGVDGYVYSSAIQADGKILVGGTFNNVGGQPRRNIARLNADGTVDAGFNPGANYIVYSFALQTDGQILAGGGFGTVGGQPRAGIARLSADGTLDSVFNPGASGVLGSLLTMAVQADGKILAGGYLTQLTGQSRVGIGRLNNTAPATESLSYNGSTVTWLRGGTSPEVWRTTFDYSTSGLTWTSLGSASRIPGGWQATASSLPPHSILRARGFVSGSHDAAWFVESTLPERQPIYLSLSRNSSNLILKWTGGPGPYQVQQATQFGPSNTWESLGNLMLTNSFSLPIGSGNLFLRVRGP
ncbi:MAG: immunoglobulin domain-containing protein [Verrucomicrobia bacterium]|nr:immunoglobulin domain-containing protein [Verrucomicrobiota bacterium]